MATWPGFRVVANRIGLGRDPLSDPSGAWVQQNAQSDSNEMMTDAVSQAESQVTGEMNKMDEALRRADGILEASDVFDIWVVARQLRALRMNEEQSAHFEALYLSKPFSEVWRTTKRDDGREHFAVEEYDGQPLVRSDVDSPLLIPPAS